MLERKARISPAEADSNLRIITYQVGVSIYTHFLAMYLQYRSKDSAKTIVDTLPKKPLNIRINEELLGQLKDLAEENQTSLTSVIESFCQYGLQQDIEISKDGVSINVNTIDEEQLQQRIQEAVDTTVVAKVKTVEDRLAAVIASVLKRLESLELQRVVAVENGQASQEVKQEGLLREYEGVSQKRLCEMFEIDARNVSKIARSKGYTNSQQYLIEQTGWVFRDKKYYPPAKVQASASIN